MHIVWGQTTTSTTTTPTTSTNPSTWGTAQGRTNLWVFSLFRRVIMTVNVCLGHIKPRSIFLFTWGKSWFFLARFLKRFLIAWSTVWVFSCPIKSLGNVLFSHKWKVGRSFYSIAKKSPSRDPIFVYHREFVRLCGIVAIFRYRMICVFLKRILPC